MSRPGAPRDAGTVPIHVQVIDLESFSLEMTVPTYLPARDLTQRVARDAGLGAYWEDGTRRIFYLRARGRLLGEGEKLEDLGVVPYELLHLLPEPPANSGLEEQAPEYPPNQGYAAAGNVSAALGLAVVLLWTAAWAAALAVTPYWYVGLFPGVGLSLLCTTFARHLWGGLGGAIQVPITGLLVFVPLLLLAGGPALVSGVPFSVVLLCLTPALIGGILGVMLGWLAWYGAVEPLPERTVAEVVEASALVTWPCGLCGGQVTQDIKADCQFGCGRVFHEGCYRARRALTTSGACSVCGFQPA